MTELGTCGTNTPTHKYGPYVGYPMRPHSTIYKCIYIYANEPSLFYIYIYTQT